MQSSKYLNSLVPTALLLCSSAAVAQQADVSAKPAESAATSASATSATTAQAPASGAKPELKVMFSKWSAELYGFAEFDAIHDSTEGFSEVAGNSLVSRPGSYAGDHERTQFSVRNSRIGFKLAAPEYHGLKASGIVEMDFLGNQPTVSEGGFFNNPGFRVRHMALKLETPVIDILAGQYWELFGWQSAFHPNTVDIQGVPGQVYSRTAQLRVSHTFKSEAVNFEVAVAALRPPERDSGTPDGQAGLKLSFNKWKGVRTGGATGTSTDAAAIGVSGVVRKFSIPALSATPAPDATATGSGISVDAMVPIIPATADNRGNGLSLTGSFVSGTGIADQYTGLSGGYSLPSKVPVESGTAPSYSAPLDSGLVAFDSTGKLQTLNVQSFIVGVQYYLPVQANIWLAANYSHLTMSNGKELAGNSAASSTLSGSQWFDANVFWDVTPAARFGFEYARFMDTYNDGKQANNDRFQLSAFYLF